MEQRLPSMKAKESAMKISYSRRARFTLIALDAVKGFPEDLYMEIVLWAKRGVELARESLYEAPEATEPSEDGQR